MRSRSEAPRAGAACGAALPAPGSSFARQQVAVARLLEAGLARQFLDELHFGQPVQRALHGFQIVELVEPLGAAAQFAHGLRPAQHQHAHHGRLAAAQVELLGEPLRVLGHAAVAAGDPQGQPLACASPSSASSTVVFVVVHHRVAVGFLVAGVHQGVQRERVVIRAWRSLFPSARRARAFRRHPVASPCSPVYVVTMGVRPMSYEWLESATKPPRGRSPSRHRASRERGSPPRSSAPPNACSGAVAGGLLVRRADRRHHARIRLHPAAAVAASARGRRMEPAHARAHRPKPPAPSWSASCPTAASISTRAAPSEVSATVKAYCALKLAGIAARERAAAARARAHPGAGRPAGGQQLRQDQPQPVRPLSAQARAFGAAGDRDAARQRALRDVFVDALHSGAAFHRAGARFQPAGARRIHAGRVAAARRQPRAAQAQGAVHSVPPPRPRLQGLGEARLRAHPRRRHPRSRTLDPGPHPLHRRPGRHLPGHDVLHHGAGRARTIPRTIPTWWTPSAISNRC